ncbi:MAG: flippase [Bacteroidetes bacterium]|nr:flippase [Bacteroidota bacterium]
MMGTQSNIAKNTIFSFLSRFSNVFNFILIIIAARYLGDSEYGIFSFALAFVLIFELFVDLGLRQNLVREVSRYKNKAKYYLGNIITIKIVLSFIVFCTIALLINISGKSPTVKMAVYVLGLSTIVKSFQLIFRSLFQAFGHFELEAFSEYVEKISIFILGIAILQFGHGIIVFSFVFLLARVLNLIMLILLTLKKIHVIPKLKFTFPLWIELIKKSFPFAISSILVAIYFYIDTVMLSFMKSDAEVGWYSAAYRIIEGLVLFPVALCAGIFPSMSIFHLTSKDAVIELFKKANKYMLVTSIPIAILGTVMSKQIILSLYGNAFFNSIISLKILVWATLFLFLGALTSYVLASIDKQWVVVLSTGVGVIVNVLLNLVLIPKYSYIGTSISTVVTEFIVFIINVFYLYTHGYNALYLKAGIRPLFATTILGIILFFLKDFNLNFFVIILPTIVIYIVILSILRVWSKEELSIFSNLWFNLKKVH